MSSYDVVVIGSGPSGAMTARVAAQHGLRVLLVDKRQELGAPIQCSGGVGARALRAAEIEPDDEWVLARFYGFLAYDVSGHSERIDYRLLTDEIDDDVPLGYIVDRRRFDVFLAALAQRAGAELWLKTEAVGCTPRPDDTVDVRLNRFGHPVTVVASVVVGADGLQSQVGRWAGLPTHLPLEGVASCLQFVVDGIDTNGLLEIITGHEWAPGGYAWVFPKGRGRAEVGVGVIRTLTDRDARWHLEHFTSASFMTDRFKHARVIEIGGGGVPMCAPLRQQYASNLILVGDAARHVKPDNGRRHRTGDGGGRPGWSLPRQIFERGTATHG